MKNKKIAILLVVVCLVVEIGINYCFFKPSKVNKYIASNLYKTPANNAFTDDNFYQCVVDGYNKNSDNKKAYTDNLSDEQLESITELSCVGMEIKSAKGVEKLTSLENLNISKNQLINVDLSNNTKLLNLDVSDNQLGLLNLEYIENLEELKASNNQIDVNKAYSILRKNEEVEEVYYLATDTTKDDKLKINDIAKLHQYVKGKINSLEE